MTTTPESASPTNHPRVITAQDLTEQGCQYVLGYISASHLPGPEAVQAALQSAAKRAWAVRS